MLSEQRPLFMFPVIDKKWFAIIMMAMMLIAVLIRPEIADLILGTGERITVGMVEEIADERITAFVEQEINSSVLRFIKTSTYVVGKLGSYTWVVSGWSGAALFWSTDNDLVWEYMDDNGGVFWTAFVLNGTYAFDAFSAANSFRVMGMDNELTIFNLTDPNWSIDTDSPVMYIDIQWVSEVDGNSHYVIDSTAKFINNYFNIMAHTNAEAGLFKYRGGSDDSLEFKGCRWNIGDGGGTVNVFLWWVTDMDHLYIDDSIVEMVNSTSYSWLFSTGANTWVQTIRLRNMEVLDWYGASTGTDSAILWRNGYQVGYLEIDGFIWRRPSVNFGGNNHQLNVNGPMAAESLLTNIYAGYRFHMYAAWNYTKFTQSTLIGEATGGAVHRSAFDFGVQGVYGRIGEASDIILINSSITVNSGWIIVLFNNIILYGGRILLANEQDAGDGPKHIFVNGLTAIIDTSDGPELFKDVIEIAAGSTQELKTLSISHSYVKGYNSLIESQQMHTTPLNVTLDDIHLAYTSSGLPELVNSANGRDENIQITMTNSRIECVNPPLDDWNSIQKGDRYNNVVWIDTSDGTVYYSEYVQQVRISSGTSSETVNHKLPARGPESFLMVTPMSDLSTTIEAWWIGNSTFTDNEYIIYVGKAGIPVNTDDDVDFWIWEQLTP